MSEFVKGLTADNARLLLASAVSIGADETLVRVTDNGFIVPDDVFAAYLVAVGSHEPSVKKTVRRKSTANTGGS